MKRSVPWLALAFLTGCDGGGDDGATKLEIVTASLPDVPLNATYDAKVEARNGAPPYTFSLSSGALPNGLELKPSTGQISGIAAQPGRAAFSISVADSAGQSVKKDLTLYVIPESLAIVTTMLPQGQEGEAYDQALVARGGVPPYTWSLDSGDLPAGIAVASEGRVMGTPTEAGGFDFMVKVADSEEGERLQMLHLFLVSEDPMITTSTVPKGRQGEPYSTTLIAAGGTPPYTWVHASGALPMGLSLANDGSLSGVPEESGDFSFTAEVTDSGLRTDMVGLTLRVVAPLAITTTSLPQVILGRSIDFLMAAGGGEPPYTWTLEGALPADITFTPEGRLSGTSSEVSTTELTIRVQDADGFRDSGLFELRVTDRYTFEVTPNTSFPPTCTGTVTSGINIPIEVTESMAIEDLDVGVALRYVNNGGTGVSNDELKVVLFAPNFEAQAPLCGDGAEIPGGYECFGNGGIGRTYDDEGAAADRPDRPLSAFDGLNAQGTWHLRVTVATPSCNRHGTVERVSISIRDDRSTDDYVVVRGYTRNNLLLAPWVRLTTGNDGGLDQHDIYLTATIYTVGLNGRKEGGKGDDEPNLVPLTWQLTGAPINGLTISNDGHVRAGAITGETTVTASGGGYVINVPLYVVPPDWNPSVREY
jgi:hypothetical protein